MMSIQLLNWFYGFRKRIIWRIFLTGKEELKHRGYRHKYRCRDNLVGDCKSWRAPFNPVLERLGTTPCGFHETFPSIENGLRSP